MEVIAHKWTLFKMSRVDYTWLNLSTMTTHNQSEWSGNLNFATILTGPSSGRFKISLISYLWIEVYTTTYTYYEHNFIRLC